MNKQNFASQENQEIQSDKGEKSVLRGEIYFADLSPVRGSEQGGFRPVLILQNNVGNRHSPTIIAAAITRQPKKHLPTHVYIGCVRGIAKESYVLLEQIRTLDRERLEACLGRIDQHTMAQVDEALEISVGLNRAFL